MIKFSYIFFMFLYKKNKWEDVKMRSKRILACAVALAMLLSFLPAFSLTASAADAYTVKYIGVNRANETISTSDGADLGYNGEKIFPNLNIPYIPGYVFESKAVDTANKTVTLTYQPASESCFFDNVANDTPFISLNMLGAHDAFTSGMTNRKDAAGTTMDDGAKGAAVSPDTALPISKAQSGNALELLEAGVRYFDIRLSRSTVATSGRYALFFSYDAPHTNGVLYTTHGLLSDEFAPIMYTVAQWAKEHPGEIVVLDFQECYDYNGGTGDSTADTWRDIDRILTASGVNDLVTLNKWSNVADQTYGSLTNNGTRSNIVLFGRAIATNNNVGKFILRGDTSGLFNGQLYSNYSTNVSIGSSYKASYIDGQVTQLDTKTGGDHAIASMFRVMQAQSSSKSNLITQAEKDHDSLYNGLTAGNYPGWLTALPVVMVDDAAVNTDKIIAVLKECNEARDVAVNLSGEGTGTTTAKTMVGTLYTGYHSLLSGGEYGYYVTTNTPKTAGSAVKKVPYDGSLDLEVKKLGSVYTMKKDERNSFNYTLINEDSGIDVNFSAYNWADEGVASDNRRIGVAILDAESGYSAYHLKATQLRDCAYNKKNTVSFYAISYEDYKSLDLSDFDDVKDKFTEGNKVSEFISNADDNTTATQVKIELDAGKINNIIGKSGKVVIFGDSHGGLYRLRNDIEIVGSFYNVTLDGVAQTPGAEVTLTAKEGTAALKDQNGKLYALTDGKLTITPTDDMTFTSLGLGVELFDGAQVRIGTDTDGEIVKDGGLRFIGQKTGGEKTVLAEKGEKSIGVEIIPEDMTDSEEIADIEIKQYHDEAKTLFTAVLTKLNKDNYNRVFVATPYVEIAGVKYYGTPVKRSIYEVAAGILTESIYEIDQAAIDVLNAYVNTVGIRLSLTADPSDGNYAAVYNGNEDAYVGGKDEIVPVFFEIVSSEKEGETYTITIKPVGKAVIDTDIMKENLRIYNNNEVLQTDDTPVITLQENGSVVITLRAGEIK